MSKNLTIAIDAMGGDFGPSVTLPAASLAFKQNSNIRFVFYGHEGQITHYLEKHPELKSVSRIVHTDKVVSSHEKPSVALRTGKDSSMRLAIDAVKNGEAEGVVSAGNTGALMAIAKLVLRCLPGINRPAIGGVFPTKTDDIVMLDMGANTVCDAEILVQFAILGSVYARIVLGVENPTVGLLNIGSEDMKGNDAVRGAASILSQIQFPGRYAGFIEGNDITTNKVNVVVTDGFTGNVALKVAEGVSEMMSYLIKEAFKTSVVSKLGAALAYTALKKVKAHMDPRAHNGGIFLGLNGICVKSHGGMDEFGFSRAILVAARLIEKGYNDLVAAEINRLLSQDTFVESLAAQQAESL